jgi:hypothetical protein
MDTVQSFFSCGRTYSKVLGMRAPRLPAAFLQLPAIELLCCLHFSEYLPVSDENSKKNLPARVSAKEMPICNLLRLLQIRQERAGTVRKFATGKRQNARSGQPGQLPVHPSETETASLRNRCTSRVPLTNPALRPGQSERTDTGNPLQ